MNVVQYKKMKGKPSKYKNKKVGKYASKKESDRAGMLKLMQQQGHISNLREQQKFVLIPSQYEEVIVKGKKKKRCIERETSYLADFTYNDNRNNGVLVVEDTKGFRTKDYIIKRKLMLQVHGIRIKET